MSFDVEADAYDRFMGRYSRLLAPQLVDFAALQMGQRVLDVGCGTGALTGELMTRLGPSSVTAVDPSEPFVDAVRARHPGVEVHLGSAEALPLEDDAFDAALAQLVVHFMADPVAELFAAAGLREVEETILSIEREHADFEEWWEPYTGGVGPAGAYIRTLSREQQGELRDRCRALLPDGPFTLISRAWAARGHA